MKNNKGFSLVELIIVIAIMAILVGVMAPQLIKYIEKTNVSADTQVADSVKTAITTAIMDPAVINDSKTNGGSANITAMMTNVVANGGAKDTWCPLDKLPGSTTDQLTVKGAVIEILGWSDVSLAEQKKYLKSSAKANTDGIEYRLINGNNVAVAISKSDVTGKKATTPANTSWIVVGTDSYAASGSSSSSSGT